MNGRQLRVVKMGGSLLDFAALPQAFRNWLTTQSRAQQVLIVGGGEWVESVRTAQQRFPIDDAFCHELSVGLLETTAKLVAHLLNPVCGAQFVGGWNRLQEELGSRASAPVLVFAPHDFLTQVEPSMPAPRLPRDWRTTSDSIAARLACCLDTRELVLLKSRPRPVGDLRALARCGFVDRTFPRGARQLRRVRFVNLRAARWAG